MKKQKKLKKMIGIIGVTTIGSATLTGCDFETIYNQQMIMYGPVEPNNSNDFEKEIFKPEDNLLEAMYGVIQEDYEVITPQGDDLLEFDVEKNYTHEVYGPKQ